MGSIPIARSTPSPSITNNNRLMRTWDSGRHPDFLFFMLKLYEAADRIEAQLLMDFLRSYHIQTVLLGDYLAGAAGQLPANLFPALWVVEDEDLPRARELVADFHTTRAEAGGADTAPWVCRYCGERVEAGFAICWNCGKPRD